MAGKVSYIPEGFHTLAPHLIVAGADKALDFYKKAFGAEVIMCMRGPDGKGVMHAEMKIGDSRLMLAEEWPGMCSGPKTIGGTPVGLHLYVPDVDTAFKRAVDAGCEVKMPLADMFWGDRYGKLRDPFGHEWSIATHKEDVTAEECAKRAKAMFSGGGCGAKS